MYDNYRSCVQTPEGQTEEFATTSGVLQGCILSPQLFKLFLHAILSLLENNVGVTVNGTNIDTLAYADDLDKLAETESSLQAQASELETAANSFGMFINPKKTKAMRTTKDPNPSPVHVVVSGEEVESVTKFVYLGSLISSDNNCSDDIKRRLALGSASFKRLLPLFKNKHLSMQLKLRLFDSLIIPVAMYACETWTLKVEDERRISVFETKCLRRIAGITYQDRVSNEDLRKQLKRETTILQKVRLQQLRWLGHIQRMENSRLPKVAFEGRVHGSRPPGRPRKRWRDNFGDDLLCLLRQADDRALYRKLIQERVKEMAPTRPLRTSGT